MVQHSAVLNKGGRCGVLAMVPARTLKRMLGRSVGVGV